jgi:hypothetical protein
VVVRRIPSFLAVVVALATIAAGCSSDPDPVQVGLGADADDIGAGTGAQDDDETAPGTSSTTTVPGTAPDTGELWLDPFDAVLSERDVDGTWDPPSGGSFDGYNLGPNQTDCDTYWILESITDSLTVGRRWFQPGANLNHDVYDSGHDEAARIEVAAVDVVDDCPIVNWLEGGSLRISSFDLGRSDAVATEVVSDVGEISWTAYAVRANLLSRLHRVHFEPGTQPSGDARQEFLDLVGTMIDRLNRAPSLPDIDELPDEFTTTMPPNLPPTTEPPIPQLNPPPVITTTTLDPGLFDEHPMAFALLVDSDLEQTNLRVDETEEAETGDPDDQRIPGCDASESIVALDGWFSLERSFRGDDGFEWRQLVGRATSTTQAETAIAQFGLVGECVPLPDTDLEDAILTGGALDAIVGGTATFLDMEVDGFAARLVAYQVGDVVGVVVLSGSLEREIPTLDLLRTLTQAAIDRAR